MGLKELLTPRQRETLEAVDAYRAEHGVGIKAACKALGYNSATYGNAQRQLRYGGRTTWRSGCVKPRPGADIASDREAFEYDDDELPF